MLPPFFEHRLRLVYSRIELCQRAGDIQHPAAREVIRYLGIEEGLEIHHDGDLPARSGIASSSAFTVGLLNALYCLRGVSAEPDRLAGDAIHIEREVLRETVGSQDQVAVAFGGLNHIRFRQDGSFSVRAISLSEERVRAFNDRLLLLYTGPRKARKPLTGTPITFRQTRPQLERLAQLVTEGLAVLENGEDLSRFGELLHEAWTLKLRLGDDIAGEDVLARYEHARSAGATGGKLMGAGGGGFMLLFAEPERHQPIRDALPGLLHVPFRFDFSGSQVIFRDPDARASASLPQ